jgi:20S proteasome subunit beta 4
MGDTLIGFTGEGYVMLAANTSQARSVLMMKSNEDKILKLDASKLLAAAGPAGDRVQFCDFIQKNVTLYALRNGIPLSTHAAANFTRGELATALRSNPYEVNLLLGGFDKEPSLYFIDYLANFQKLEFGCQGYAGYFLLGLLDKYYKKGLSLAEGKKLMKICIQQMKTRFVLNTVDFMVKIITKDGIQVISLDENENL